MRTARAVPVEIARVDAVRGLRAADVARVIGEPARDVAGILREKRELTRLEVQPVSVEDFLVALVEPDEHEIGEVAQIVDDLRAHAFEGRKVLDR